MSPVSPSPARPWRTSRAITLAVAVIAALVVLAVGALGWRDFRHVAAETKAELRAETNRIVTHADRTLEAAELAMEMLASRFADAAWTRLRHDASVGQALAHTAARLPQISNLWLVDQNGFLQRLSDEPRLPVIDLFDRPYWQAHGIARSNRAFISAPLRDRLEARRMNVLSLPIYAGEHSFRGVIAAALTPAYYEPLLAPAVDCDGCTTAIVRTDGTVLVATPGLIGSQLMVPRPTVPVTARAGWRPAGPAGTEHGEAFLTVAESSSRFPVQVVSVAPSRLVVSRWLARFSSTAGLGAGALMLLGLGGWSLRRMAIAQEQSAATAREAIHRLAEAKAAAEDRQHAEAAARREAAEANRAKSEFLAMMSHELRTPLNAILGFSEVIAGQTLGKEASDRYSDYAQNIHDSGQHLLALINDILDLSRIEAGRVDLDPVPIDLGEIIETVTTLVSRRRGRAAIPIRREILAPVVVLDERAAKQILVNLVGNAVKFTEAGEVRIAARWRDGWLQIVVADTGPGMDVEEVRRAREPFCQVDMSLARRHEGTGLGLPITERLVALLGGTMEIDSTPGVGTTVTVRLPAAAYTGAPAAIAPDPAPTSERVA